MRGAYNWRLSSASGPRGGRPDPAGPVPATRGQAGAVAGRRREGRSQPGGRGAKQFLGGKDFPEEVSCKQGTNSWKRKVGRGSAKALRPDPRGGAGPT